MSETFDNNSSQVGEFIELPQRIKILADAIIELTGADHPKDRENTKESRWRDLRTKTTINLQRKFAGDNTYYFTSQYDTLDYSIEMLPVKQYVIDSSQGYSVERSFARTERKTPTSEEEASDPADELYDLLNNGPLDDPKKILDNHEAIIVNDRFRYALGAYAVSDIKVVRSIKQAQEKEDPIQQEEAFTKIVNELTQQYEKDNLTIEEAYLAVKRYQDSNQYNPPKKRWPRKR